MGKLKYTEKELAEATELAHNQGYLEGVASFSDTLKSAQIQSYSRGWLEGVREEIEEIKAMTLVSPNEYSITQFDPYYVVPKSWVDEVTKRLEAK